MNSLDEAIYYIAVGSFIYNNEISYIDRDYNQNSTISASVINIDNLNIKVYALNTTKEMDLEHDTTRFDVQIKRGTTTVLTGSEIFSFYHQNLNGIYLEESIKRIISANRQYHKFNFKSNLNNKLSNEEINEIEDMALYFKMKLENEQKKSISL